MSSKDKINCPNCNSEIDVSELLYHKVDQELKEKYKSKLEQGQEQLRQQQDLIYNKEKELKNKESKQEENIKKALEAKEAQLKKQLLIEITNKVKDEQKSSLDALNMELKEKTEQIKQLHKANAEIERLKRENLEIFDKVKMESEQELSKQILLEKEKIELLMTDKIGFKVKEKDIAINQLNEQLKKKKKKVEQGSTQTQGEVQELIIEDFLKSNFPLDSIIEIKKGAKGGDCLQQINTRSMQNCGLIYYESKRTKVFQPQWIEKFKKDIQEKNANIGILVTETMPQNTKGLTMIDGIWICSFNEFKLLSIVIRDSLINLCRVLQVQHNKGDKMEVLYNFLTGTEFKMQVEGILEGFSQMSTDLDKEKRAMQGIWKKREKQLEKVLLNTTNMYSSIKGIAGDAVANITYMELDDIIDD